MVVSPLRENIAVDGEQQAEASGALHLPGGTNYTKC
jgi:hypothetical protein